MNPKHGDLIFETSLDRIVPVFFIEERGSFYLVSDDANYQFPYEIEKNECFPSDILASNYLKNRLKLEIEHLEARLKFKKNALSKIE